MVFCRLGTLLKDGFVEQFRQKKNDYLPVNQSPLSAHHMTTDNVGSLNHDNLSHFVLLQYSGIEFSSIFFKETFTTHTTQISKNILPLSTILFSILYRVKK